MPLGLNAIPMGVSTSLDTNGICGGCRLQTLRQGHNAAPCRKTNPISSVVSAGRGCCRSR
ncbi:hypothetical protein CVO77_16190 [Sphingopyxis lindanitolerans]|uniref:Uncharacterized protein n=1 Tax=Sphingopyxis lindanitolerans TaxID=2054227 RepID=A0A2S8B2C3_9SPHN|nr:hypothetical protein CVO77_16190 [Sphingopyxis lindanitolerans]